MPYGMIVRKKVGKNGRRFCSNYVFEDYVRRLQSFEECNFVPIIILFEDCNRSKNAILFQKIMFEVCNRSKNAIFLTCVSNKKHVSTIIYQTQNWNMFFRTNRVVRHLVLKYCGSCGGMSNDILHKVIFNVRNICWSST